MWMQICLGIHGLIGGALFLWGFGRMWDPFFPRPQKAIFVLVVLGWLLVGWLIARTKPMPSYRDQPEAKFTPLPSTISFAVQIVSVVLFLIVPPDLKVLPALILLVTVSAVVGGPVAILSWLGARIGVHVGTWAVAWLVTLAGLTLNILAAVKTLMRD